MEFKGLEISTDEEVYPPAEDSFLAADVIEKELEDMEGDVRVLDMGCASGILGMVAATKRNVESVLFADINEDAVKLCKRNLSLNRDYINADTSVVQSDLFEKIDGNFDMIIFNAPYLREGVGEKLSREWYGGKGGIELSVRFLKEAKDHLNEEGLVILVASSFGDLETLSKEISRLGFAVENESRIHVSFEDIVVFVLGIREALGS